MESYSIFICTAPGDWQLIGNSPARFIAQQIAEKICQRQSFAQQELLAVLVTGGPELEQQSFIYKPIWNSPNYGYGKLPWRPGPRLDLNLR